MGQFFVRVPGKGKAPDRWSMINDNLNHDDPLNEPGGGRLHLRTQSGWAVHDEAADSAFWAKPVYLRNITQTGWYNILRMRRPVTDQEVWLVAGPRKYQGERVYIQAPFGFSV